MTTLSSIAELIGLKDEAISLAIHEIVMLGSKDHADGCDVEDADEKKRYHWRGCPDKIQVIVEKLQEALKAR